MNQQTINPPALNPDAIALRDIHLPEPVSWWPLAPGWWMLLALVLLVFVALYIGRNIYKSRQLKRDIKAELKLIKQQFQQTGNKSQLAKDLSILLRRANISYYPETDIAGLTGKEWLNHLDKTNAKQQAKILFQSNTGQVLLNAPYLPDTADLDYDATSLLSLCESWLLSTHAKTRTTLS